ncbi:MAG: Hsp33 family molecular chaperone [Pseudomonadota bacterium]
MAQQQPLSVVNAYDDLVLPFRTEASGISGRIVRLGPAVHDILSKHDYPVPVAEIMGQALALTALLGSQLKFDGKLILQTRSDGPLGFFVTNFQAPGHLRGYASFDADKVADLTDRGAVDQGALLGEGHLALTIDQGRDMDRYQGIVPLDGSSLSNAARLYFRQSEQLPTSIHLGVARDVQPGPEGAVQWRAGGLMVQHVSPEGGVAPPENAPIDWLLGDDDENWQRVAILAETVETHELTDPTLSPERLLLRLFHEEGVRVFDPLNLASYCQCDRNRILGLLATFGKGELDDMITPTGDISVTCEFCNKTYLFKPETLPQWV